MAYLKRLLLSMPDFTYDVLERVRRLTFFPSSLFPQIMCVKDVLVQSISPFFFGVEANARTLLYITLLYVTSIETRLVLL